MTRVLNLRSWRVTLSEAMSIAAYMSGSADSTRTTLSRTRTVTSHTAASGFERFFSTRRTTSHVIG